MDREEAVTSDVQERITEPVTPSLPAGMQRMVLPAKTGKLVIHARILAEVDNDTGDRLRWAQLKALLGFGINAEIPETYGKNYYLLYAIGHSLAVHDKTGCRGSLAQVRAFPDLNEDWEDLEPCTDCECSFTRDDSPPDAMFKLEVTRYSHTQYLTAVKLTDALRKCRSCGHRPHEERPCGCGCKHYAKGDLSQIGQRLLDEAKLQDSEIAAALPQEIHL